MKQSIRAAIVVASLLFLSFSSTISAQQTPTAKDEVAKDSALYCTGFISEFSPRVDLQIVGGEKENEVGSFSQGDVVYLNQGRETGVHSGAVYYVTRPLGAVKHPFTSKKVGYFVRELGLVRVLEAHAKTSVAEITVSCDSVELGDTLRPYEAYSSPGAGEARPMPRYSEGAGGLTGQIIMSPKFNEYVSANQLVFIDLGNRQGVRPGDQFLIYRKITSKEGVARMPNDDIVQERSEGYGSDRFKGGDFSTNATHVSREKVVRSRPTLPRKVMGELVVLKVENTAAVALVTRTTAEVNIGDFVEMMK
jgi:hypothetical protein